MSDEPKLGERWKQGNKLYQVDLITENFVILSAVHGDSDDGMVIPKQQFGECGLKKVEKDDVA